MQPLMFSHNLCLDWNLKTGTTLEQSSSSSPRYMTYKDTRQNICCSFKLLNDSVICYSAINSQYLFYISKFPLEIEEDKKFLSVIVAVSPYSLFSWIEDLEVKHSRSETKRIKFKILFYSGSLWLWKIFFALLKCHALSYKMSMHCQRDRFKWCKIS
jgi:hypothetical protein